VRREKKEGRRKKREERREKKEGRRKKGEERREKKAKKQGTNQHHGRRQLDDVTKTENKHP
jgi:hypothetical protein